MFVFKQQSNCNSESSGTQHVPHDSGEHLSHDKTNHSGICALELEIYIMIISIYLLTYTYKVSHFNGPVCSS